MKRQRDDEDDNDNDIGPEDDKDIIDEKVELRKQEEDLVKDKKTNVEYDRLLRQSLDQLFEYSETNFITVDPNPTYFKGSLRQFQLQGLSWMLSRESFSKRFQNQPRDWIEEVEKPGVFVNTVTDVKTLQQPVTGLSEQKPILPYPLTPVFGGILADEMGLGKTIQMISLICTNTIRFSGSDAWATMVVCPVVLLYQWKKEIEKNTNNVKVLIQHGQNRTKKKLDMETFCKRDSTQNIKIVLTSYDTLRRDILDGLYQNVKFLRLCLDEAHEIRNFEKGKKFESANSIRAFYRWAITGTPIQNKYEDFFALLKFLRVRPYGEFNAWYRMIELPISQPSRGLRQDGLSLLRDLRSTLVLRRTKADRVRDIQTLKKGVYICSKLDKEVYEVKNLYLTNFEAQLVRNNYTRRFSYIDKNGEPTYTFPQEIVILPKKTITFQQVNRAYFEDVAYKNVRDEAKIVLGDKTEINILTALTYLLRLRQISVHPLMVQKDKMSESDYTPSAKISWVMDDIKSRLRKDPTSKFIIFSIFTKALDLVSFDLKKKGWIACKDAKKLDMNDDKNNVYCRLDGSMNIEQREMSVELFQEKPSVKVLLCSLLATSVGLNLTKANTIYFLDLHYNPQIHAQAIDRAHRIGQTRPVDIIFVIMNDSVEEKILKLLDYKNSLSTSLLQPVQFGRDKVLQLLSDTIK